MKQKRTAGKDHWESRWKEIKVNLFMSPWGMGAQEIATYRAVQMVNYQKGVNNLGNN